VLGRERYLGWLPPLLIAGVALSLVVALRPLIGSVRGARVSRSLRRRAPRRARAGRLADPAVAVTGLLLLLTIAPAAYAGTTWLAPVQGTFPAAGPRAAAGTGGVGLEGEDRYVLPELVSYVRSHGAGSRFAVLTVASVSAAPLILMGVYAAALGGYGGTDPALDGPGLARLVARGEARYVLLGGPYSERGGNGATQAVLRACKSVPRRVWGGPALGPYSFVLFDCAGRAGALARP
jgi:hypothetical protein